MANGDAAAQAGLETVPSTGPSGKARMGYDWINYALDRVVTWGIKTAQLVDGAVTTPKLANGAVTHAKTTGVAKAAHTHIISDLYSDDGVTPYGPALQQTLDGKLSTVFGQALYEGNLHPAIYSRAIGGNSVYITSGGLLGHVASAARFKDHVQDANLDPAAIRQVPVRTFTYIPELGLGEDTQVGLVAEELMAAGFDWLVGFDDGGRTLTVHYERVALLALTLAQDTAARVDALEARLDALDGGVA